jgi:hypothetical protein
MLVAGLNHSTPGAGIYEAPVGSSGDVVDHEQHKSTVTISASDHRRGYERNRSVGIPEQESSQPGEETYELQGPRTSNIDEGGF